MASLLRITMATNYISSRRWNDKSSPSEKSFSLHSERLYPFLPCSDPEYITFEAGGNENPQTNFFFL